MNKLFILGGPTGVGKTTISLKLAEKLSGEIISADSMQIYKYMDIGSAKIKCSEMGSITHHMIDIIEPSENFSAADFKDRCEKIINDIYIQNKLPMVVGGTGLYIDSLINNYSFSNVTCDEEYRKELLNIANEKGNEYLHSLLYDIDKKSASNIHPNNIKRVIRALEIYKLMGKPMSEINSNDSHHDCKYKLFYFVLVMNRQKLYDNINCRVDKMVNNGLVDEVIGLKKMGLNSDMQSMKGIGYKEILYYLDNKISLSDAIELIKKNSRNYAKRQLTWFRRDTRITYINKDEFKDDDEIISYIIDMIKKMVI